MLEIVSIRHLERILGRNRNDIRRLAAIAGRFYEPFDRQRIGDKKWRHIDNPKGEVKELQTRIYKRLLRDVALPSTVLGGVPGKSIRDNASVHVGKPVVVTIDIRNCFPTISHFDVFRVYRETLGCSTEISSLLTKLTTWQTRLPQGAPTSSALANLALLPMHTEIQRLLTSTDTVMTAWVDDIALSGSDVLEQIEPIVRIVHRHGHAIRRRKVKIMPSCGPQAVTGVGVNRKVAVTRTRQREIREDILRYAAEGQITEVERRTVLARITQAKWLSPTQGSALERFALRKLPDACTEGRRSRGFEIRRCHSARRHRRSA